MRVTDYNTGSTHPVGKKEPNELGIYDMSGNVWEWTNTKLTLEDIKKLNSDTYYRSVRGGSWFSNSNQCQIENKDGDNPFLEYYYLGFRITRTKR